MNFRRSILLLVTGLAGLTWWAAGAAIREEHFDREPPNWEGINNRTTNFPPRIVTQDFGFDSTSRRISQKPGEIGGKINPAGEPAYYAHRLPKLLSLDEPMSASGNPNLIPSRSSLRANSRAARSVTARDARNSGMAMAGDIE